MRGHVSDPENTEAADLQRKLEMLNNIMDQEARAEQARRQMQYFGHCKLCFFSFYIITLSNLTQFQCLFIYTVCNSME